jgi:hypothetical protein
VLGGAEELVDHAGGMASAGQVVGELVEDRAEWIGLEPPDVMGR